MKKIEQKIFSIDLDQVIANKSPRLSKRIPKFITNYLKRIIYQDELNTLIRDNKDYQGVEFTAQLLKDLNIKYNFHNSSVLEKDKKYVFVSNHPLGGIDSLVIGSYLGSIFQEIKFIANDLLMNIKALRSIFVPVNKFGRMKQSSVNLINEAYSSDAQIIYFPAGICSRLVKGKIIDLEWKQSFLTKALEYKRDIVPIYFEGQNSKFFYRLANIRKFLGIKFNLELIYLPGEIFKQKNSTFDVYIGKPIQIDSITKEYSRKEWVNIIRKQCYNLKPPPCNQSSNR